MIAPMAWAQTNIMDLTLPAIHVSAPAHDFLDGVAMAGDRIVVVGEHGLIAYSDDDGRTWRQAAVPVSVLLTDVAFANAQDGWAVGHMGVILHTSDGGMTWQKQIDGRNVDALSLAAAQAAQAANSALPTVELAVRRAELFQSIGPDRPFLAVLAQSPQQAIVVGAYRMAIRTNDGGKNWSDISLDVLDRLSHNLYDISSVASGIYVSAETGIVFYSTDGGATFPQVTAPTDATLFGIAPTADGSVFAYGVAGAAYLSHDHGATWQSINVGTTSNITSGLLLKSGALVLVSETGGVYISNDNGLTFRSLPEVMPMLLTALAQMPNGDVVVTGSSGVKILSKSDFTKTQ
ncbi:WD40/YVTN/BNR-like repeat-containing protein [Acidocella aquatica]|nr:YCF48-related protein [Acidocella aquatica]